jgi:DNA invertase Pin-like site-specific DNA recombinase
MTTKRPVKRAALYARVSTNNQTAENQLLALRAEAERRGWAAVEYVDTAVSGSKASRPALDAILAAARSRKLDVVSVVKLDRLARSVHHLLELGRELDALGVHLVVLDQPVDTTIPAGRLMFTMLGAIAEFERDLIRDRIHDGLTRARAQGKHLGRRAIPAKLDQRIRLELQKGTGIRRVARRFNVGTSTAHRIARELRAAGEA